VGATVYLYAGRAAVLASDVGYALDLLGVRYVEVDDLDVRAGRLDSPGVFVVPGGYTSEYVSNLGDRGFENIRRFVGLGGGYLGICAGAYLAASRVEVPGRPLGLGIVDVVNRRRKGRGVTEILVLEPRHPVMRGYSGRLRIWYQNGPYMEVGRGVKALASYDGGYAAIAASRYENGYVVLFSPHPEGNREAGVRPEDLGTLGLLRNAISYATSGATQRNTKTGSKNS